MWLKQVCKKYLDIILYLFFGVCTTLVNIGLYWMLSHLLCIEVMLSTVIAWIGAVLFAYFTNRVWVFHSEAKTKNSIIKEIFSFFVCRIATGLVDWGCMFVFVELMGINDVLIKTIANLLVIILNYVASKLVIFKKEIQGRYNNEH